MKIRMIALAGVAALALAGPAAASDATGWYLGLGAGWDHLGQAKELFTPGSHVIKQDTDDSALVVGSVGYRFADRVRLEVEIGWDRHDATGDTFGSGVPAGTTNGGRLTAYSAMFNAAYDVPLTKRWAWEVGAGFGVGRADADLSATTPGPFTVTTVTGKHAGYEWQFMTGPTFSINDNLDLSLEYRYRSLSVTKAYGTGFVAFSPQLKNLNEQALMVGVRWYLDHPAPPPPVMAPPPPPPPPVVKPVTTYIVFFDFNKSNLTTEAESVVSEAVKTAKANGMVKVMITGHTDTVGSDTYNMALSVRRAQSVKDAMVSQGMGGDTISIEGKGFHDPLVATGPGVREPQNRRAVIDLGS